MTGATALSLRGDSEVSESGDAQLRPRREDTWSARGYEPIWEMLKPPAKWLLVECVSRGRRFDERVQRLDVVVIDPGDVRPEYDRWPVGWPERPGLPA
jgi:hypothetical protein